MWALGCRKFKFSFIDGPERVGMASGATIHTANGLKVRVERRQPDIDRPSSNVSAERVEAKA